MYAGLDPELETPENRDTLQRTVVRMAGARVFRVEFRIAVGRRVLNGESVSALSHPENISIEGLSSPSVTGNSMDEVLLTGRPAGAQEFAVGMERLLGPHLVRNPYRWRQKKIGSSAVIGEAGSGE
jgi:hypothetical protein